MNAFEELYTDLPKGWEKFFLSDGIRKIVAAAITLLEAEKRPWCPKNHSIFRSFYKTKPKRIKVVILGQDPYHSPPDAATGLAFSIPKSHNKINPSVANIKKVVKNSGFDIDTTHGNLEQWCDEGVFLYNTALTVAEGDPRSHTHIWSDFTTNVIAFVSLHKKPIVFVLWGRDAYAYNEDIKNKDKHCVLVSSHPSGFSAFNKMGEFPSFMTSDCFNKANEFLEAHERNAIDWS